MSFFKAKEIIKIPGKTFDNLSAREVALMIEADSSLSEDGNEFFSSCALDEFLYGAELERKDLCELRDEILQNIYVNVEGQKYKDINTDYLKKLCDKLNKPGQTTIGE